MAYRTYVGTTGKEEIQILGNNEYYQPLIDELKRQGYEIENACYGISFDANDDLVKTSTNVKEIQPIIDILEQYIWDKDKEMKNYFKDVRHKVDIFNLRPNKNFDKDFTARMIDLQENGYIFATANLVNYLKDNLERKYDREKKKIVYKIKEDKEVWFRAY
jgi:hypothetical protein